MVNIITVNGMRYEVEAGNSASVTITAGGDIIVNGRLVAAGQSGRLEVHWDGPLAALKAEGNVIVKGDVHGNIAADGNVNAGNVGGNLAADGNVVCGNVSGSVSADGNVVCRRG